MDRWDLIALFGALLIAAGVAMVYVPAGLIALGATLVALSVASRAAHAWRAR